MAETATAPDVFKALADPTRREILHLLLTDQPLTVNEISQKFTVSRQAVTKHITYLSEAGLVRMESQGRNTLCFPDFRPMKDVNSYIHEFRKFWSHSLDKLEEYLDSGAVE